MTVFLLVALVTPSIISNRSGSIIIEFDTKEKCETALKVIDDQYSTWSLKCLEIKK